MNWRRVSKAIAGGIAGAVTALGGSAGVAVTTPNGTPSVVQMVLTGIAGFVVGYIGVYMAPPNDP